MVKILEKVERRLGEKLFIKGDRCAGPKCALTRRSFAPGAHGKARRREPSEFGQLLREKQKIRFLYGLDDRDVKRYAKKAALLKGTFSDNVLTLLERRLDNVIFRLGFADSRRKARQAVRHGHIAINGKTVSIPSYQIKKGEVISIKERSLKTGFFAGIEDRLRGYEAPRWFTLDKGQKQAVVAADPNIADLQSTVDITKIKEFYSR